MATVAPVYEERRVSISRVFQRAINALKINPIVIIGLSLLIGALPSLALNYAAGSFGLNAVAATPANFSFSRFFEVLAVSMFIAIIVSTFVQAAMTRATVSASEGRRATIGECLGTALMVFVPLIAMAVITGIAVWLGMILLIVPGVILFLMWSVASPTLVIERVGIFDAFRRSAELTKGAKWKILGMLLLLMIAYWLLSLVVGAVGLTMYSATNSVSGLTTGNVIGSIILGTVVNAATGTFWPSLYVELRQWKEGTSVENLAEVFA